MPYNRVGMRRRAERAVLGVDERLVMPGAGIEILEGEVVKVPGADPPHATRHSKLSYLLEAHVAVGFVAATDMLTRASEASDFAPDASVFPEGRDRDTGGRRLEVLAFEVVGSQRLTVATRKARVLSARGVRRIFALVISTGVPGSPGRHDRVASATRTTPAEISKDAVLEWDRGAASPKGGRWRPMHRDETIEDASLASGLPVRALLDGARADEAVLAAIEARRPDLVATIEARGEARGEAKGMRRTIESLCAVLDIALTPDRQRHVRGASRTELARLADTLTRDKRWPRR